MARSSRMGPHLPCCSWLVLALLAAGQAQAQDWKLGRATFYGSPDSFSSTFDASRGKGSFGELAYGSCGFTESDGSVPFAREAVASVADGNKDYPGSCGRCYAVRCKEGLVLDNDGSPVTLQNIFYMPWVTKSLPDSQGRWWQGNSAESKNQLFTKCYDWKKEIVVRVIDECPCTQILPDGAPGVKKGGDVRRQTICCGGSAGNNHFGLSYWAFEQLAHPLNGLMMVEYRQVDCDTYGAVNSFLPGYISKADIYKNGVKAGWGWWVYFANYKKLQVQGVAPDSSSATCVDVSKDGGISFSVKQGYMPGYQPFRDTSAIQVQLKSNAWTWNSQITATPKGSPPDLKVFLQNTGSQMFCESMVRTRNYAYEVKVDPSKGDSWWQITIPIKDFRCERDGALVHQLNRIDFQNDHTQSAQFCLANLRLVKGDGNYM